MSSIVISGDTSGAITLAAPAVSGTNTATLPAATGTVMVSGNMPAFSAWQGTSQSLGNAVFTKIQCNTKEFDTANAFDSTTNYRFTPQVAGYYQVNGAIGYGTAASTGVCVTSIWKNGSEFKRGNVSNLNISNTIIAIVSSLIYMNGSTDYLELYGVQASGGALGTVNAQAQTYFQAVLVRGA